MNNPYLTVRSIEYSFGNDMILCVHASTVLSTRGKIHPHPTESTVLVRRLSNEAAVSDFSLFGKAHAGEPFGILWPHLLREKIYKLFKIICHI
jgi:hypothetical protein